MNMMPDKMMGGECEDELRLWDKRDGLSVNNRKEV